MKVRTLNRAGNPAEDLPLFAWSLAERERRQPIPFAATWLRRRHPLSPARATLLATLAGLSVGGA